MTTSMTSAASSLSGTPPPQVYSYDRPHPSTYVVLGGVSVVALALTVVGQWYAPSHLVDTPYVLALAAIVVFSHVAGQHTTTKVSYSFLDQFQNLASVHFGPLSGALLGLVGVLTIPRMLKYPWIACMNVLAYTLGSLIAWAGFIGSLAALATWVPALPAFAAHLVCFLLAGLIHQRVNAVVVAMVATVSRCHRRSTGKSRRGLNFNLIDTAMAVPVGAVSALWSSHLLGIVYSVLMMPMALLFQATYTSLLNDDKTHHRVLRSLVLGNQYELAPEHVRLRIARTQAVCRHIGRGLGYSYQQLALLFRAVELHDIGRVAVAPEVRTRPLAAARSGSDIAFAQLRYHLVGERMLDGVTSVPDSIRETIRHHHDRYDGADPEQTLSGRNIPLNARILHVANTFVALTTPGTDHAALSSFEALKYISDHLTGTQLCPRAVAALTGSFPHDAPWAHPVLMPAPEPEISPSVPDFVHHTTAAQRFDATDDPTPTNGWYLGFWTAYESVYEGGRHHTTTDDATTVYAHDAWLAHDLPEVSAHLAGLPAHHLALPPAAELPLLDDTPYGYLMLEYHSEHLPPPSQCEVPADGAMAPGAPSQPPLPRNPYRPRQPRFRIRPTE